MRRAEKAAGCHILFARCLALNNPIAQSLNQLRAEGLAHANYVALSGRDLPGCKRPMTPSPPLPVSVDTDLCDVNYTCEECGSDHHSHNQNREVVRRRKAGFQIDLAQCWMSSCSRNSLGDRCRYTYTPDGMGGAMSKFERLLQADSTELPDCRCGAEMDLTAIVPVADGDTEIRIFRCPECSHELRLTAWRKDVAAA
jgi:hypothetical protein